MKKNKLFIVVTFVVLSGCVTGGVVIPLPTSPAIAKAKFSPPFEVSWTRCLKPSDEPIEIYPFELSEPVYSDGKIVVGSRSGRVFCFDVISGTKEWEFKTIGPVESSAAIDGGIVYIGDDEGYLYVLDLKTGGEKWRYRVPEGEVIDRVAHVDGYVAFATTANSIALLSDSGEFLWMQAVDPVSSISVRGFGSPVFYNNLVIAGFADGTLRAFEVATGKPVWRIELKTQGDMRDIDSDPVISDGTIFTAAYRGNIYAIDLNQANILWRYDAGSVAAAALGLNMLFYATDSGTVVALDAQSGKEIWDVDVSRIDMGGAFFKSSLTRYATATVYDDGYLIFGTSRGNLAIVDANSGKLVFKRYLSSSISARPLVVENMIVVHTDQDCLYAFVPR